MRMRTLFNISIAGFLVFFFLSSNRIQAGQPLLLRAESVITLDEKGDAAEETRVAFQTSLAYQQMKTNFPNPYALLRHLAANHARAIYANAAVQYDDMNRSIVIRSIRVGMASSRGGKWRIDVGERSKLIHDEDGLAIFYENTIVPPAMIITTITRVVLPPGSGDLALDQRAGQFTYSLSRTQAVGGYASLAADLTARENIMSALYKIYGDSKLMGGSQWVGRAELKNEGDADATDVRVRYRLGEFADWSPESRYDVVPPGGTIVDFYYPLFKASAMQLDTYTPAYLEMQYSYRDERGDRHEEHATARTRMLGRTSFLYSNLPQADAVSWADNTMNVPLMAAFVTRMDPIVREFAGLAAQASGGAATYQDDEQALAFCKAAYDLMVKNGISYQSSVSFLTENANLVQDFKYPRDVLRDRAGTCVELAIFYAAVCEAGGLPTGLVSLPGHCFAVVKLPSGRMLPVENTFIRGAAVGKSDSFEKAVEYGEQEMKELEPERFYIVETKAMHELGIISPELPPLPPDTLKRWGIQAFLPEGRKPSETKPVEGGTVDRPPSTAPKKPTPEKSTPRQSEPVSVLGAWEGKYGPEGGDQYAMRLELGPRFAGTMRLLDENVEAKIISALCVESKFAVAATWSRKNPGGGEQPVYCVMQGDVQGGVWNGMYKVLPALDGPTLLQGKFSLKLAEPLKLDEKSKNWRDVKPGVVEGELAGIWRGLYTNSWGDAQELRLEARKTGGNKYAGTLSLPRDSGSFSIFFGTDVANYAVLMAESGDDVISLTGKIVDGVWEGESQYSTKNAGDTGKFILQKEGN